MKQVLYGLLFMMVLSSCRSTSMDSMEDIRIMVGFIIQSNSYVTVTVENSYGTIVQTVIENKPLSAGQHTIEIDSSDLIEGVYFCKLYTGRTANSVSEVQVIRMILINYQP
ncbi:hypothetical protein EP331_14895 [bacterium]|nr:MAG: hypothetical protein EP331_14895 [bacterium]